MYLFDHSPFRILALIFMCIFCSFFCYAVWYLIQQVLKARRSLSWPSTEGTIAKSFITKIVETNQETTTTYYRPSAEYEYEVDNVKYRGNLIAFLTPNPYNQEDAEVYLERYPAGKAVSVYYDPLAPGDAVLERGLEKNMVPMLSVSIVLSVIIIIMLFWLIPKFNCLRSLLFQAIFRHPFPW